MFKALRILLILNTFFVVQVYGQLIIKKGNTNLQLTPQGNWQQVDVDEPDRKKVHSFNIPFGSNMLIEGINEKYGVRYNPDKWEVLRGPNYSGSDSYTFELEFFHKEGDGFALVIADTVERPIYQIIDDSIQRIKSSSSKFRVAYGEVFKVNKNMVYMVILQATQRGIPITFYNYYHSGEAGSYQLLSYCSQQSFWKFEDDFKDLLNGFIILNE